MSALPIMLNNLIADLNKLANKDKAKVYARFFKIGKGHYGEGDVFLGLTMPQQRTLAKKYNDLSITDVEKLLHSKIHEHRMTALIIWTYQFEKANKKEKVKIYKTYLKNLKWINNWDLVDVTTPKIIGMYLLDKPNKRKILYKLAKSRNLWEKRVAILATFAFIHKKKEHKDTIAISEILLKDKHDLIHKAVGWMLREVGKRDILVLEKFIQKHYKDMPRTTLRYSIEKFEEDKRKKYLLGKW